MFGAAVSGYLGWRYGYTAVFLLAAVFRAISVACIMMIPGDAIDNRAARGKEDDPESQPSGFTVLVKHKPLLILALALAAFHLGNAAIIPLYGLAATADGHANGSTFVATTIVVAQAVMILTSIVGMRAAESRNYWLVLLASFLAHLRGDLAFFLTGWWARSLYMMSGDARRIWEHSIPAVESPRYSITFRTMSKAPDCGAPV